MMMKVATSFVQLEDYGENVAEARQPKAASAQTSMKNSGSYDADESNEIVDERDEIDSWLQHETSRYSDPFDKLDASKNGLYSLKERPWSEVLSLPHERTNQNGMPAMKSAMPLSIFAQGKSSVNLQPNAELASIADPFANEIVSGKPSTFDWQGSRHQSRQQYQSAGIIGNETRHTRAVKSI